MARYICKKQTGPDAQEDHYYTVDPTTGEVFYVTPPYVTMSRRPRGLGAEWFDKYKTDVFPHDSVVLQARHFRPPKYYDNMLKPEELETIKNKRREAIEQNQDNYTEQNLKRKYELQQRRYQRLKRTI